MTEVANVDLVEVIEVVLPWGKKQVELAATGSDLRVGNYITLRMKDGPQGSQNG